MNIPIPVPKKPNCSICNKKLSYTRMNILCRCSDALFCEEHFNNHNCKYNYKKDYEAPCAIKKPKLDLI